MEYKTKFDIEQEVRFPVDSILTEGQVSAIVVTDVGGTVSIDYTIDTFNEDGSYHKEYVRGEDVVMDY